MYPINKDSIEDTNTLFDAGVQRIQAINAGVDLVAAGSTDPEWDSLAEPLTRGNDTDSAVDTVVTTLNQLSGKYPLSTVFVDFVDLFTYFLRVDGGETGEREIIEKYTTEQSHGRSAENVDEVFWSTVEAVVAGTADGGKDILGAAYEETRARAGKGDSLGQYFSPPNVATMMNEMVLTEELKQSESEYGRGDISAEARAERTCIGDITGSGSGRLLVPAAHQYPDATYTAVDIDPVCAKLTAINLALANVDGQVLHADALKPTNEDNVMRVYNIYHDPSVGGLIAAVDPEYTYIPFADGKDDQPAKTGEEHQTGSDQQRKQENDDSESVATQSPPDLTDYVD